MEARSINMHIMTRYEDYLTKIVAENTFILEAWIWMADYTIAYWNKNSKTPFDMKDDYPNYSRRYRGSEELIYPKETARAIYVKYNLTINMTFAFSIRFFTIFI